MKVTICELPDAGEAMQQAWSGLTAHVRQAGSQLVLLPEMPFFPWIAAGERPDADQWQAAVQAHADWMQRFDELAPATVLGSQPVLVAGKRFNQGYVWHPGTGHTPTHEKYYLPDEPGFREASWYDRGDLEFRPVGAGGADIGFAICSELWFTEHARSYARQGVHLLVCPRATERATLDKWIAGGTSAAVMSGSFCISSNRSGEGSGISWGGAGWIIDPDGGLLAKTAADQPYLTLDLDLAAAEQAKHTYPRDVPE